MVVAIVPCKGESVRVLDKNKRFVGGEPLWLRKARMLDRCECVNRVVVDSDDKGIREEAARHGFETLERPGEVNEFDGHELFAWHVDSLAADVYVEALCTAPFVTERHVKDCVGAVLGEFDTAYLVERRSDYEVGRYPDRLPNSVDLSGTVVDCMSLYAVSGKWALEHGKRTGGNEMRVRCRGYESIDVDYETDLEHARLVALGMKERDNARLRALEGVLGSALVSDCLEEQGIVDYAMEFEFAPEASIVGRACTLGLSYKDSASCVGGIYDALQHYDWCMPGDLLVVETGPVYAAYFGELNSLLAHRAGARGCIVEHATRDSGEVVLPVWSDYRMPSDCRDVLGVRTIGGTVEIQGVAIEHGELLVADADGVVRIPREIETETVRLCLDRADNEARIKMRIAHGFDTDALVGSCGEF